MVGNGWYNPLPFKFWGHIALRDNMMVGPPAAILRLQLLFTDGSKASIVTRTESDKQGEGAADNSGESSTQNIIEWKVGESALLRNDLYLGNVYDFDREKQLHGWSLPGFDDGSWAAPVQCDRLDSGPTEAQPTPPIKSRQPHLLTPKSTVKLPSGNLVLDMGVNHGGTLTLSFNVSSPRVDNGRRVRSHGRSMPVLPSWLEYEVANGLRWLRYPAAGGGAGGAGTGGTGGAGTGGAGGAGVIAIELKYGEILFPNGSVNPLTSTAGQIKKPGCCGACAPSVAYQRDVLLVNAAEAGAQSDVASYTFTPAFTWHAYRFLEISIASSTATPAILSSTPTTSGWHAAGPVVSVDVHGIPISTALDVTGEFESGHSMLNDIFEMVSTCKNAPLIAHCAPQCPSPF
jgi:hypothetical protein